MGNVYGDYKPKACPVVHPLLCIMKCQCLSESQMRRTWDAQATL